MIELRDVPPASFIGCNLWFAELCERADIPVYYCGEEGFAPDWACDLGELLSANYISLASAWGLELLRRAVYDEGLREELAAVSALGGPAAVRELVRSLLGEYK